MTDWTVRVQTETGYVKDVEVYDFNYPDDAIRAALNQTGTNKYISYQPMVEANQNNNSSNYTPNTTRVGSIEFGPQYNSKDKLQIILILFAAGIFLVVFPPLTLLLCAVFLTKVITMNFR